MKSPRRARVARAALPLPHPGRFWILFWVCLLMLVSLLFWTGGRWRDSGEGWRGNTLWSWINQFYDGAAGVIVGSNGKATVPASIRFAALTLLVLFIIIWRRTTLHRCAYRPGPVDVPRLVNATEQTRDKNLPLDDLTAQFRRQLSETSLYPPPGVPETPEGSVLDLIGDVDPAPEKLGASLMRVIAQLRPKLAYRVQGELRTRIRVPEDKGITVTVTSYALRGCRIAEIWAKDWTTAVNRAACWVVASILPVTSECKRPPWRKWYGHDLPPELFTAVQEANRLANGRRYDEAMGHYYAALRLDQRNPHLRFALAVAQKECGLYIDALDMIQGAIIFGGQREEEYNHRLWASNGSLRRPSYLMHLMRRPDAIDERYDYTSILAHYDELPIQWCERSGTDARAAMRNEIRQRLTPLLVERYWPAAVDLVERSEESNPDSAKQLQAWSIENDNIKQLKDEASRHLQGIFETGSTEEVRLIFQRAYAQEMYRLAADYPLVHLVPGIRPNTTWTNLRLCRDLLGPLRLSRAWVASQHSDKPMLPRFGWRPQLHWWAARLQNLPSMPDLAWRVRTHLRFSRPLCTQSRQLADHYNAACVYAVAMQDPRISWSRARDLAQLAVDELGEALRNAESGYMSEEPTKRIWWTIHGDPDFRALRQYSCFKNFVGRMYPHEKQQEVSTQDVVRQQEATYDERVLAGIALSMERVWHARESERNDDIHRLIDWFKEEHEVWQGVRKFAGVRARDWPTRLYLTQRVNSIVSSKVAASGEFPLSIPSPEEIGSTPESALAPRQVPIMLSVLERDLLGRASPIRATAEWIGYLREIDASRIALRPPGDIGTVCRLYAGVWQKLNEWLESESLGKGEDREHDAFLKSLKRIFPRGRAGA